VSRARLGQDVSTQATWQVCSILLAYPDDALYQQRDLIRSVVESLPPDTAEPLTAFVEELDRKSMIELAAEFTETFDHQRRCCLYLTYYAHGDTRKRGMALLSFKQRYRAAGWEIIDGELPDHLAVVLEFAAGTDLASGRELLIENRAGIELLRFALEDRGSPYAHVLRAVTVTLPELQGPEREAVIRLAAEGPPEEQVGLQPFAPPEFMPYPAGGAR
jgi:nitrate reductase delta subunit